MNTEAQFSPVTLLPCGDVNVTESEAKELDRQINEKSSQFSELVEVLFELAILLKQMKATRGYKAIGFDKWSEYLASKPFSKTYLYQITRLGFIEDLEPVRSRNIPPTILLEYVTNTDFPEKVQELIDSTWEQVKDKTVREAREIIGTHVNGNRTCYKKARKRGSKQKEPAPAIEKTVPSERPNLPGHYYESFQEHYRDLYSQLSFGEQVHFRTQLRRFLDELK